jgi:hypothetical protein
VEGRRVSDLGLLVRVHLEEKRRLAPARRIRRSEPNLHP